VAELTVVGEDVLDDAEQLGVDQCRPQLLGDLADDRVLRPLPQLDTAADQPWKTRSPSGS
jgi:hypothetical protein